MIKFAVALGAGYTGFRLAYNSQDGRYYGKVGDQHLRSTLSLLMAALAAGITYVVLFLN